MSSPTTTLPLPLRLTQTLGLTTSLFLAGQTLTLSTFLIPRILDSPTPLMLHQWNLIFQSGRKIGPSLAVLATASYWYLAFQTHVSHQAVRGSSGLGGAKVMGYLIAGLLAIGIVPYTLIFIGGTNEKLLRKVEEVKTKGKGEIEVKHEEGARQLVDWWGMLNLGRGMLVLGSGVLGVWTVLS